MSSIHCDNYQQDRITLICKPEQSGKTFVMIQQIIRDLKDPSLSRTVINIILCDNNLLLTKQTSERVEKDLQEVEVNGESYLEFSSHSRTDYNNADAVVGSIIRKGIRNILCCTNGTRVDDIYTIISDLNIVPVIKENYINLENKITIENKIYNSRNNKMDIFDENGRYIFYQINNIESKLPALSDIKFM